MASRILARNSLDNDDRLFFLQGPAGRQSRAYQYLLLSRPDCIAEGRQDKPSLERGLFDEETVPEELTQVRMGKIVKDKYPEFNEEDQEAVRQHAVAALNLTQKAKEVVNSDPELELKGHCQISTWFTRDCTKSPCFTLQQSRHPTSP